MKTYVMLINYTQKGIENVKESPARLEKAKAAFRAAGGEMKAFYLAMGRYDMVVVGEAPDDVALAKVGLAIASAGSIRTETLRVFTEDEYKEIIAGLP
jgi:uncharacterized protein with GYD domain